MIIIMDKPSTNHRSHRVDLFTRLFMKLFHIKFQDNLIKPVYLKGLNGNPDIQTHGSISMVKLHSKRKFSIQNSN